MGLNNWGLNLWAAVNGTRKSISVALEKFDSEYFFKAIKNPWLHKEKTKETNVKENNECLYIW